MAEKAAAAPNGSSEYPSPIPRTVTINMEQSQVFDLPPTDHPDHNTSSKDPLDLNMACSADSIDDVMQHAKETVNPPPKQQKQSKHRKNALSTAIPLIPACEAPAEGTSSDRIRLGICAMDKKARSKPMAEILSRLDETLFHVIFFGDDIIKNEPVEEWPCVDVIIAFYSKGYPLEKAKEYVKLKKPFILNDLDMQEQLKDRRCVYDLLVASGIDVPRHVFLSRDDYVSTGSGDGNGAKDREVTEFDDHIEVNGVSILKPFVEKPIDADDHNIAIYYPSSAGGGCKKLFRKIGNRSSEFYPDVNEVRRDGSYIYEDFLETQGTDVKMYTVGPEYGHAEARKSPAVDGKVQRNSDGKEIRFPVILTLREKEIARRIVLGFKQFVCGFDLLRVQEGHSVVSMVCDVNGWSFVKNSRKYYDDCSQILTEHMLAAVKPTCLKGFSTLDPLVTTSNNIVDDDGSVSFFPSSRHSSTLSRVARRLQSGELKEEGGQDPSSLSDHSNGLTSAATTLLDGAVPVRDIPDNLTSEPASICHSSASSAEEPSKMKAFGSQLSMPGQHQEELRCVIAVVRHGDRTPKQKLKVNMTESLILKYFHDHSNDPSKDLKVKAKQPMTQFLVTVQTIVKQLDEERSKVTEEGSKKKVNKKLYNQLRHMRDVLERWKISGLNRKLQIKPRKWKEDELSGLVECTEVQLILKWGGNLTKLGELQSIKLGQRLRHALYPDSPGGGILRLHSTFRHDLKIKTSDEGRVMKTAAAFAKGLLELEGEIPPILVSLVHKEKGSMHMLDPSGDKEVKLELDECKEKITANLQRDIDFREASEDDREQMVGPLNLTSMRDALAEIGNPRKTLMEIVKTMRYLLEQLEEMLDMMGSGDEKRIEGGEGLKGDDEDDVALSGIKLYKGETLLELTERWRFIYKRLYDPDDDVFDLSRIPDVHDNVRFDVLHNPHLGLSSTLEKLYELAKSMADCVVPQEYGTTVAEKRSVGVKICSSLLDKLMFDLNIARTDNKADMRYMINMDYSADLPINTMGRRIRTRLYFTSESHLHTMLNVLRFAGEDGKRPILSKDGNDSINNTRELCYLTQIVIRLFEDTGRSMDDPRRFRVEILFSPGATATPLHIQKSNRDVDTSRFDTAPLVAIGRDGLTCKEVEDFFGSAILEGRKHKEDEHFDVASYTTHFDVASASTADLAKQKAPDFLAAKIKHIKIGKNVVHEELHEDEEARAVPAPDDKKAKKDPQEKGPKAPPAAPATGTPSQNPTSSSIKGVEKEMPTRSIQKTEGKPVTEKGGPPKKVSVRSKNDKLGLSHQYFWSTVAVGTLLLGAGCIVMALSLTDKSSRRRRYRV